MRNFFLFIFAIVFVAACSSRNKVPKGILPKKEMQEVIWDMLRAGEFLDAYVFKDSTIDKKARIQEWNDKVYQLHHTTKAEFEKSYNYYRDHPLMMKEIMDSLSKKQFVIRAPRPATGATHRDSTGIKETLITKKVILPLRDGPPNFMDSIRKARFKHKPELE